MKKFILLFCIIYFTGCNIKYMSNIDTIEFKSSNKKEFTYDSCTNMSYIYNVKNEENQKLFVEYINLDNSCRWNGFQRGYFEYLFKTTLKLKSFELIERKDYKNFEFSTYLINDEYYMNLIYKYSTFDDIFIIDYSGEFFTKEIKQFDKNYNNIYIDKKRFFSNYSNSLVKMNFINSYFSKEREFHIEK